MGAHRLSYLRRTQQRRKRASLATRLDRYLKLTDLRLLPESQVRRISDFDPSEYGAEYEDLLQRIHVDWTPRPIQGPTDTVTIAPYQPERM